MQQPAEQTLIERIVKGDEDALRELYGLLAPRAYSIALRVLKDPGDAEDVLQETFVEVWRSATRYDSKRAAVDRWVTTMIRTRAIDRLRKRQARDRMMAGAALTPAPHKPTPEALFTLAQNGAAVRAALASLPNEQREALELAYFEGLSQSEISEKTATPLGTVKTRMRLAMIKLADALPRP